MKQGKQRFQRSDIPYAEQMCNIPCGNYWKWWDMRMAYMKRRLGL